MQSDETLARGVQQGKQADMTELVNRYYAPLLGYLFRLCGGVQLLAEDLVQETFLRMIQKISLYDAERPFKPWLYTIATNIARNHYQRADTRYVDSAAENSEIIDRQQQPETSVIQMETEHGMMMALSQLPDHQREVVLLFYYEELSQKEIALILNIPVGTVKSRLSLGLKHLRTLMKAQEF